MMMPIQEIDLTRYGIETQRFRPSDGSRTLMIIYAHPDDETFSSGATIAQYAMSGVNVHYVCATGGESGTVRSSLLAQYGDVRTLRAAELTCAAQALGLTAIHRLGHRDSGMRGSTDNAHPDALVQRPQAEVVRQIVALVRTIRPHVIVTHGPYGGYGHPDHIAVHKAVKIAYEAAGQANVEPDQVASGLTPWAPRKLYYNTFPYPILRRTFLLLLRLSKKDPRYFGVNGDVDLVESFSQATPITTVIRAYTVIKKKEAAWRCHRSQLGSLGLLVRLPTPLRRYVVGMETYTRVLPTWQVRERRERDLFSGL